MPESASFDIDIVNFRRNRRVPGPFDGRWVGLLTVPMRIYDLSVGGCLIQAHHEQPPGRRFLMEIELPDVGWVRVEAESVYQRDGYGFAARFVSMSDDARRQLESVVDRLSTAFEPLA